MHQNSIKFWCNYVSRDDINTRITNFTKEGAGAWSSEACSCKKQRCATKCSTHPDMLHHANLKFPKPSQNRTPRSFLPASFLKLHFCAPRTSRVQCPDPPVEQKKQQMWWKVECKGCIHGFGRGRNLDIKSGFWIICVQIYLFNMLFWTQPTAKRSVRSSCPPLLCQTIDLLLQVVIRNWTRWIHKFGSFLK